MTKGLSVIEAQPTSLDVSLARPAVGELHLWYWDQSLGSVAQLNHQEQTRYERLIPPEVRQNYLSAHAGMQTILGTYLGMRPGEVEWRAEDHGKPYLVESDLRFNLSHSSGANLLAVSGERVGVDIERIRSLTSQEGLACRYYTEAERHELNHLPRQESRERFFEFWTRKEAFVKLLGIGLQGELSSIDVRQVTGDGGEVARANGRDRCWMSDIRVPEGFRAAIASDQRPESVTTFRLAISGA